MSGSSSGNGSGSSGNGVTWSAKPAAVAGSATDGGSSSSSSSSSNGKGHAGAAGAGAGAAAASRRRPGQRQRRVKIEDELNPSPVRRGMKRVDTKAEFRVADLSDDDDDDDEGGWDLGDEFQVEPAPQPAADAAPAAPEPPVSTTQQQQQQQQQQSSSEPPAPTAPGGGAAAAAAAASSDPAGPSKPSLDPPAPLPFLPPARAILKKTSTYSLQPPSQLNGEGAFSSGSGGSLQGGGPMMPRKSQRTLSFADELGRDLHEVHTAHNTQYSNKAYHRPAPVECCVVS